jgi:EAL domain-containing protein (putative c-di-GMP-specific phosphodiesterase class I)
VETKEQLDFVQSEGCQNVQGFYFSRALSVTAFEDLMMETDGLVQPSPQS